MAKLETLHGDGVLYNGLKPSLQQLRSPRLALQYEGGMRPGRKGQNRQTSSWLRTFLSLTPSVERLALWVDGVNAPFDRVLTCSSFTSLADHIHLEHLGSLALHDLEVPSTSLRLFSRKHTPALTEVLLRRVALLPSEEAMGWSCVLHVLQTANCFDLTLTRLNGGLLETATGSKVRRTPGSIQPHGLRQAAALRKVDVA